MKSSTIKAHQKYQSCAETIHHNFSMWFQSHGARENLQTV